MVAGISGGITKPFDTGGSLFGHCAPPHSLLSKAGLRRIAGIDGGLFQRPVAEGVALNPGDQLGVHGDWEGFSRL